MNRNEVLIVVKARNATKAVFDEVRRDAATLGDEIGDVVGKQTAVRMEHAGVRNRASYERAGEDIGDVMGNRIRERLQERVRATFSERFKEKVKVDVDVETSGARSGGLTDKEKSKDTIHLKVDVDEDSKRSFRRKFTDFVDNLAESVGEKLSGILSAIFSPKGLSIAAALVPLSTAVGAAISAGVLLAVGGGFIGAGIAGALKDPQIQGAIGDLGDKMEKMLAKFGEPFRGPVANFLEKLAHFLDVSAPKFQEIADIFAPVADELGTGLIALLQNALPGILDAAEAAAPLFETLAARMPEIGDALSEFFSAIADSGPGTNEFFDDLLQVIIALIPIIGDLIGSFAFWYQNTKDGLRELRMAFLELTVFLVDSVFSRILDAAEASLGWIPGVGDKLRSARKKFTQFREDVNDELGRIKKEVRVRVITEYISKYTTIASDAADSAYEETRRKIRAGKGSGGIVGAAAGGIRSGLKWVGEQGPELMSVPPGTTVHSAADSQRMMRGASGMGAGGSGLVARFQRSGNAILDELGEWVTERLRVGVRTEGAGDVQQYLGAVA